MVTVNLLGLCFDDLSVAATVTKLLKCHPGSSFAYVVTPNADHIARLYRVPALAPIYENARLCLLDSHLIANVARLFHLPTPQVATGTDVTALLLSSLVVQTVAVIGLSPAYLPTLQERCPATNFIHHTPPMDLLQNPEVFTAARDFAVKTKVHFTLIALGSPLQELLAQAIAAEPGATGVGLCIGAVLEFCAGVYATRAAMDAAGGLEWLHRRVRSPRRLTRRYLIDSPPVLFALGFEGVRPAWLEAELLSRLLSQDHKIK
jgi:N-acetylglucosaminyldiphosphoundecaprenol N-acetyl-beta-D-mannosaminyltransferase